MKDITEQEVKDYFNKVDWTHQSLKEIIMDLRALNKSEDEIISEVVYHAFVEGYKYASICKD